jgi:hypothetical protein
MLAGRVILMNSTSGSEPVPASPRTDRPVRPDQLINLAILPEPVALPDTVRRWIGCLRCRLPGGGEEDGVESRRCRCPARWAYGNGPRRFVAAVQMRCRECAAEVAVAARRQPVGPQADRRRRDRRQRPTDTVETRQPARHPRRLACATSAPIAWCSPGGSRAWPASRRPPERHRPTERRQPADGRDLVDRLRRGETICAVLAIKVIALVNRYQASREWIPWWATDPPVQDARQ